MSILNFLGLGNMGGMIGNTGGMMGNMGGMTSFMGKGMPSTQMLNTLGESLYGRLAADKKIENVGDFHLLILDIFSNINSALPGKHLVVPSRLDVEECYEKWREARDEREKKEVFIQFINDKVHLNKVDDYTMMVGIVTPPAAMAAKRAGEMVPQLKMIKSIPDVVFVPAATVLAIISARFSRSLFMGGAAP